MPDGVAVPMKCLGWNFWRAFLLILSNSSMIVFVVMSGQEYPDYMYSFAVLLCLISIVGFILCHFLVHGLQYSREKVWEQVYNTRFIQIAVGLLWAFNYVFLLNSNPYVPGVIQVIFNEANIVVVIAASRISGLQPYTRWEYAMCLCAIIGGVLPIAAPSSSPTPSSFPTAFWDILYLCGTIPIALANVYAEHILKAQPKQFSIGLLYACVNVWTLIFVFALSFVPALNSPTTMWTNFSAGMVALLTFKGIGAWWTWIASIISVLSTYLTLTICRDDVSGATFATLLLTVAPAFSGLWMGIHSLFGKYYSPLNWTA
jgi:hypothetical protein